MIYTWSTQVAAVVPYGGDRQRRAGAGQYQGQITAPGIRTSWHCRAGLFTLNSSGQGLAAAFNQDGTLNGPGNPAQAVAL